ncbi:MAG: ATP-binding cassette domain-containing protein, partial [Bacteroidetes bacterium]
MNESMLHSLMRLFAIIVSINRDVMHVLARNFVETFLIQQFSRKLADKFLAVFDEYSRQLEKYDKGKQSKRISSLSVKVLAICEQVVTELHIRHRFMILLSLIRFSRFFAEAGGSVSGETDAVSDAVLTVSDGLLITREEFDNVHAFITDKFYSIPDRSHLLIISDDPGFQDDSIRHLQKDNLAGQIFVLRIRRADSYLFRYTGKARLEYNGKYIFPRHVYLLPRGSAIRGDAITPVYYSDIISGYINLADGQGVEFLAEEIEFFFNKSSNGIRKLSFQGRSGQLVGIIGGSGSGKSTLLKVLSGSLELKGGNIYINGYHLKKESEELEGMIGYVPQDDLLMEELTVYRNLWFNARLCLDGYTPAEVHEAVTGVLNDLDLYEIRNLKVGSILNKFISGGQRKRLNIALELIRGPHILFVDEPTSGLSS